MSHSRVLLEFHPMGLRARISASEAHRPAQHPYHELKVMKSLLSLMSAKKWKPRSSGKNSILPGSH